MDLRTQQRTAVLLMRMAGKRDKPIECIPYAPQKISFYTPEDSSCFFARSTPEEQGIDSGLLAEFLREAGGRKDLNMHSVMVLRNAHVIAECNVYPYEKGMWHVTHSLAKSITSLGVGMLVDDCRLSLDDKVVDFFPNAVSKVSSILKKDLTVRHLLTMTSGVTLNEVGSVTEKNWIKAFLNSGTAFKPGTEFRYNSMNTYMLSAIVQRITGQTLFEYMKERMFEPMGIKKIQWESCPMGITKGGWGMYILPEDIAKIAQLIIDRGIWKGKRIVSEKWIDAASSFKVRSDRNMNDYGYGYQIWMGKRRGSCQFNGMLGQNAYIFPDINMIIVSTAGNGDLSPKSSMTNIVESYFGDGFRPKDVLDENIAAQKKLAAVITNLENPEETGGSRPEQCSVISGSTYKTENRYGLLLPIFIQGLQNNHSKGISKIEFENREDAFYMCLTEGDSRYEIPVGFDGYKKTELNINGEPYIIKTRGKFATDEDDNPVLKINMPFIETANTRKMKIFFIGERIRIEFSETPGLNMAVEGLSVVINTGNTNSILYTLVNKASEIDPDYLEFKVQKTLSPTVFADKI